jgi:hypothetical protein
LFPIISGGFKKEFDLTPTPLLKERELEDGIKLFVASIKSLLTFSFLKELDQVPS